ATGEINRGAGAAGVAIRGSGHGREVFATPASLLQELAAALLQELAAALPQELAASLLQELAASLLQELAGVDYAAVVPDLEVHVGAGGAAGGAGLRHLLPGADQVADPHQQPRIVGVAGHVAVAVVDLDHVAVA